MPDSLVRAILLVVCVSVVGPLRAENTLQGLEMDVMEPGESAAHATARIALPRRAVTLESGSYPGLETEQRPQLGGQEGVRGPFDLDAFDPSQALPDAVTTEIPNAGPGTDGGGATVAPVEGVGE